MKDKINLSKSTKEERKKFFGEMVVENLTNATKRVEFLPKIKTLKRFDLDKIYTFEEIRNEVMLFTSQPRFALNNNCQITHRILNELKSCGIDWSVEPDGLHWVIDTRVTMTMPKQYPSIPGWHCDDVPREEKYKQPNFNLCRDDVVHYLTVVSDTKDPECTVSGTEFITSCETYDIDPTNVWGSLHNEVMQDDNKHTRIIKEREIIQFNQLAIHRATPSVKAGWRLFFRLSLTYREPANTIRNQVQIYVDPNDAGW